MPNTTEVYHWGALHSQECVALQESDPHWDADCECECERGFSLEYRDCPLEADSDGYITIPPYTIESINDLIDWRCDGHCTVAEAIASSISDCLPGLNLEANGITSLAIKQLASGEWSLRDVFIEDHCAIPTTPAW